MAVGNGINSQGSSSSSGPTMRARGGRRGRVFSTFEDTFEKRAAGGAYKTVKLGYKTKRN